MSYNIEQLLEQMIEAKASDLHLTTGVSPVIRVNGELTQIGEARLKPSDTQIFIQHLLNEEEMDKLLANGEYDVAISKSNIGRFRLNVFRQRGSYSLAIRHVNSELPDIDTLGIPHIVKDIAKKTRGLFLVTGPTGSGKSTTLASIISLINQQRSCHILTLEDPIEYLHKHNKSIVNQREVGRDTKSYANALRAALREDPDVILIGEMRDLETISIALTAAETGHLVLSTLHTIGAAKTIDRIIDVFPTHQQQQIKVQISSILIGILSQVLILRCDIDRRIAAYEVMLSTPAIKNMIRENKTHQVYSVMQTSQKEGMNVLDDQLVALFRQGMISAEHALMYSLDTEYVMRLVQIKNFF